MCLSEEINAETRGIGLGLLDDFIMPRDGNLTMNNVLALVSFGEVLMFLGVF